MTNQQIIAEFKKAAAVLTVIDNIPFRIRAYQNAIEAIQNLDEELHSLHTKSKLTDIPGIGKELSEKIHDLLNTGKSEALEKLFSLVPAGMFPLLDIPGLGAKRANFLATTFHLTKPESAIATLKSKARTHQVQLLDGFGPKLEAQILENLSRTKPKLDKMLLHQADRLAQLVIGHLQKSPAVQDALPLGSLRRRKEVVGDVDIGVVTANVKSVTQHLKTWDQLTHLQAEGQNLIRITFQGNHQADIKFTPPEKLGAMLQHFTGSKLHNVALREKAIKMGLSLSEHGIKEQNKSTVSLVEFFSESDFYHKLHLNWIPPELRENTGEIEAASSGNLPLLVENSDILGDTHTHTHYDWVSSHDYGAPVTDLLTHASKLGYHWFGLGDHNPSRSKYPQKHDQVQAVKSRQAWIEQQISSWKKTVKTKITIFSTLEVDILKDGSLALADEAIRLLDYALISIHSSFTLDTKSQTQRLLHALSHPGVKVFAHPTGRLLNQRPPINVDWSAVFKYCAAHHIALEINANPRRLDLPDSLVKEAKSYRVKFLLGTDAHQVEQLDYMPYAVDVARRGWLKKSDILNTYSSQEFQSWLNK